METLQGEEKPKEKIKSATEEENNLLQELSTDQNRNRKEKTKSKDKEQGMPLQLQRPISVPKTTLPATKIKFPFSTERTAGDPSEEIIF